MVDNYTDLVDNRSVQMVVQTGRITLLSLPTKFKTLGKNAFSRVQNLIEEKIF